jgi:DnaK suppressor protein
MNDTDRRRRFVRSVRRALQARLASLGHAVALEQRELEGRGETEDLAREASTEETQLALLELGEGDLGQLRAALGRLDDGTYGRCVACSQEIPVERLRALPVATRCLACQRRSERTGVRR